MENERERRLMEGLLDKTKDLPRELQDEWLGEIGTIALELGSGDDRDDVDDMALGVKRLSKSLKHLRAIWGLAGDREDPEVVVTMRNILAEVNRRINTKALRGASDSFGSLSFAFSHPAEVGPASLERIPSKGKLEERIKSRARRLAELESESAVRGESGMVSAKRLGKGVFSVRLERRRLEFWSSSPLFPAEVTELTFKPGME